ncbi:MAG TPA: hypothetical protein VHA37_00045 [Candidatus Saccharimonadales bacterium]|nr:hypothetical protein [Candidatus Saccharimonadales bacterium]
MTDEERFYQERDRRTRECGVGDGFDQPVRVVVGADAVNSPAGQSMVLALVNMLARIHRNLQLDIPAVELLTPSLVPSSRLDLAAAELARAIDPFIRLDAAASCVHAIGIGANVPRGLPWYAGADGQIAIIDREPVGVQAATSLSLGGALSACMAAAAVLRQVLGHEQRAVRLSAWNCREGIGADRGPDSLGPLDVGDVLQVGAGGVGLCLAYWLRDFGVIGDWHIADRDDAVLHNTNRCIGLLARDAGWPGGPPRKKAVVAAELFGGIPHACWYDEFDHDLFKPDLVLPLANEHDVRHAIACRGEPVILHATTSRTWEAQLHRHLPGSDDCITCRMPSTASRVKLGCSTVSLETSARATSSDAALPFLSATAGLLLLSGLYRLQFGQLTEEAHNFWAACFRDVRRHARSGVCACREGCATVLPAGMRRKIHAGRRWSHIDQWA